MKVVMFGNYALYFIPRLIAFSEKLKADGGELWILQASKENLLYGKIPQADMSVLDIVHIWDAPEELNYKQKAFYMLDKLNPDVLVTGFISFPYGAIGLKWAKSRKRGLVEYDDQRIDTFNRSKISNWVKTRIIRNVDAFLCPAPAWDETLLAWGFHKNEIFYGLDTSDNDFWGEKVENTDFRDLPQTYFMTVGRQGTMKNLPRFLHAYKEYINRGGTIPLVMVGNGPEHEKLIKIADDNPHVIFLDFQPREKIRQLFIRMKALVLSSTKVETWGMVVNECMASGHIVAISKECGSATTLVKDGLNGFHFSPESEKEMVEVLFKIQKLSDDEFRKMGQESLNIIKEWGLEKFVDGVYAACKYAYSHKKRILNPINRLLVSLWNGRYNISEATK
jgi:glycosyltransferase involved in cell wall biosynthesis